MPDTSADITLINMNMYYVRYCDGRIQRQNQLALGPLMLVSSLEAAGLNVDFRDYQLCDNPALFDAQTLIQFLKHPAPVIGISVMANLLPFILFALPDLKAAYPDSVFIIGGVGPLGIEHKLLERFPDLDIIHRGEGELSVPLLVKALRDGSSLHDIPNIFFRENGVIVENARAPRIQNLDALPLPAYDHLAFNKYIGHNILASRGCPFPCTFCSLSPMWEGKPVLRSIEAVIAEMAHMHHTYGVSLFLFQDEYFTVSPQRSIAFAECLRNANLNITYKAFARVDCVNEDSLAALGASGCTEIRFGIESGSDSVLKKIRKGITAKQSLDTAALAKKYIRNVDAFFMWGFPFETMDDFQDTLLLMITLRGMGVRVLPSMVTYLPQMRLYKESVDPAQLEFCPYLLPEYMISGIEKRHSVRVEVEEKYRTLFDFITDNKEIFPGFFQLDVANNIEPKLALLEEFEFYMPAGVSTGAHMIEDVLPLPIHSPLD